MFNIQLSDLKKSTELPPSSRSAEGSSPGVKGWQQCTADIVPRVRMQLQGGLFQGCSAQGIKGSCPGELQGCVPGPPAPLQPPALTVSTFYPTAHKLQLQLHRDSLGRFQQGWLSELAVLFALFLVIPSALLVCCQGNTALAATRMSLLL